MHTYISNVKFALVTFPVLAALFTLPYMVYEYRKFGSIPMWKTLCVYAFAFYALCACYMVVLPLPADRAAYHPDRAPQLQWFHVLRKLHEQGLLQYKVPSTWFAAARTTLGYEALFNVALTVPLGMFLRYFWHLRWWQAYLCGWAVALLFEVSQLTGLFGYYLHPYRTFDVDDLLTNSTGALVGFWLAIPLTALLPDIDRMNERAHIKGTNYVTFTRRLVAFGVDLLCAGVAYVLVRTATVGLTADSAAAGAAGTVAASSVAAGAGAAQTATEAARVAAQTAASADRLAYIGATMAATALVFVLVPMITRGQTPGHKLLRITVARTDGAPAPWWAYLVRYGLLFWVFGLVPVWAVALFPAGALVDGISVDMVRSLMRTVYFVWGLSVAVRALLSAFGKPFVLLTGLISDTRVMTVEQAERLRAGAPAGPMATMADLGRGRLRRGAAQAGYYDGSDDAWGAGGAEPRAAAREQPEFPQVARGAGVRENPYGDRRQEPSARPRSMYGSRENRPDAGQTVVSAPPASAPGRPARPRRRFPFGR